MQVNFSGIESLAAGTYFVAGIDTDIGKTHATGQLARALMLAGRQVITQKLVQTGCVGMADDVLTHREIMEVGLLPEDRAGLTMPAVLAYPASPHLAVRLDEGVLDLNYMTHCSQGLAARYELLLIEGAGGLFVPLVDDGEGTPLCLIDHVAAQGYPVILVTSGRLGSINHTLLSLQALAARDIRLTALIYNHYHDSQDATISADTQDLLCRYLGHHFPDALWWEI